MTNRAIRWWKKQSFWNKLAATFASLGIGTEVTLFFSESEHYWKYIAGAATIAGMLVSKWFEDKNKNGVSDCFEDDPPSEDEKKPEN